MVLARFTWVTVSSTFVQGYYIRRAELSDAAEVARLAGLLGYPASAESTHSRLMRLLDSPTDLVLVAEGVEPVRMIGWIHSALSQHLESEYRAEITGLIVDGDFQRKGVGRGLVERAEAWAREQGVHEISVRCRTTRPDAHSFYETLGFAVTKTQVVFRKRI